MDNFETDMSETLITLTSDIVAAHVSNNSVSADEVTALISNVYGALANLGQKGEIEEEKPKGAVSERKSLSNPAHIISMIDGKPYKMLKRHIGLHGYTPESYRETFNLRADYPLVARDYAETRRDLAKKIGLGRNPSQQRGRKKRTD